MPERCDASADRHLHRVRIADNKAGSVIHLYAEELGTLYPAAEVKAIMALVFHNALGWPAVDLALRRHEALSESELLKVYLPLKRLRTGEPVQYVLGHVLFHGLRLTVDQRVLIPRPETEEMVARIAAHSAGKAPGRILDIGTGSGCIALALKKSFPKAEVIGMDVSNGALDVARENAGTNGLDVKWIQADALDTLLAERIGQVDLLVSNPPYVPQGEASSLAPNVRDHEPHAALFVPDADPLLFYRTIAQLGLRILQAGGQLWFEVHHRHGAEVLPMLTDLGYARTGIATDLSGMDRFVHAER